MSLTIVTWSRVSPAIGLSVQVGASLQSPWTRSKVRYTWWKDALYLIIWRVLIWPVEIPVIYKEIVEMVLMKNTIGGVESTTLKLLGVGDLLLLRGGFMLHFLFEWKMHERRLVKIGYFQHEMPLNHIQWNVTVVWFRDEVKGVWSRKYGQEDAVNRWGCPATCLTRVIHPAPCGSHVTPDAFGASTKHFDGSASNLIVLFAPSELSTFQCWVVWSVMVSHITKPTGSVVEADNRVT